MRQTAAVAEKEEMELNEAFHLSGGAWKINVTRRAIKKTASRQH